MLKKMTDQHLINRLNYFEKKLANKPPEAVYIGDSVYAEDCVDMENANNECLAEDIREHINEIKEELKKRGGKLIE